DRRFPFTAAEPQATNGNPADRSPFDIESCCKPPHHLCHSRAWLPREESRLPLRAQARAAGPQATNVISRGLPRVRPLHARPDARRTGRDPSPRSGWHQWGFDSSFFVKRTSNSAPPARPKTLLTLNGIRRAANVSPKAPEK